MDIINETNALIKKARKQELRYIDPANLDNYDKDDIEKVRDANGNVRYKRKATSTGSKQAGKKESDDTVVFDIDFSNKAQAKKKLDEFKTKSIQAFTKFIKESKSGTYLSYTIRRANSRYNNDYILYFSILFDYGYYNDEYKIEITTSLGSQTTTLHKKVASKASTIESVIKDFASKAVSCLAPLYESQDISAETSTVSRLFRRG